MTSSSVEREPPIAVVLLNRPKPLNALSDELMDELVERAAASSTGRGGALHRPRRRGRAFAAGADIERARADDAVELLRPTALGALGRDPQASGSRSSRRCPATASAAAASSR